MLAPNRLLTSKEQWLIVGIIAAVLAGSASMLYVRNTQPPSTETSSDSAQRDSGTFASETQQPPTLSQGKAIVPITSEPPALKSSPPMPDPALSLSPVFTENIGVAVMGAVRKPGLYMTPPDFRVSDLITLAGGVLDTADLSEIALTATLIDETTLTVPEKPTHTVTEHFVSARRPSIQHTLNPSAYLKQTVMGYRTPTSGVSGEPVPAPEPYPATAASGALLNINQASLEQLQTLPGIGPVLAASIIEERTRRPFSNIEDLDRVPGIGEKRIAAMRPLITAP